MLCSFLLYNKVLQLYIHSPYSYSASQKPKNEFVYNTTLLQVLGREKDQRKTPVSELNNWWAIYLMRKAEWIHGQNWWEAEVKFIFSFLPPPLLFFFFLAARWGMWDLSSLSRDWTCTHCIGRQSINHWTRQPGKSQKSNLFLKCCLRCQWDIQGEKPLAIQVPFPTPGESYWPGIEPALPASPALQADSLLTEPGGKRIENAVWDANEVSKERSL